MYLFLAVSRAFDTSDLRLVKWSLRSGEGKRDAILYALLMLPHEVFDLRGNTGFVFRKCGD